MGLITQSCRRYYVKAGHGSVLMSAIGAKADIRQTWRDVSGRARKGLNGPFGSPVFACAGKTEPPSHLILSQTSAGN